MTATTPTDVDREAARWRIGRFLAAAGLGARRKCEELVTAGRVTVNGQAIDTPAVTVDPLTDVVCCDGRRLRVEALAYVLLYKPRGYTCSAADKHAEHLVYELMPKELGRLVTVGRLDCDSEGLLILTNDGRLVLHLTHPRYEIPKTYRVWARGLATPDALARWKAGVEHAGEILRIAEARIDSQGTGGAVLTLTLKEGKKREIRRLCQLSGLVVMRLQRLSLGPLQLGELKPGEWRHLTPAEVAALKACVPPPAA